MSSRTIVGFAPYNSISDNLGTISWVDLSHLVREVGDSGINVSQGKSNEQSDFDTAKATIMLDGRNRELDPVVQAPFNPVANPGFELGALTSWTQTGAWSIVDQKAALAVNQIGNAPMSVSTPFGHISPGRQVWSGQYSATHSANAQASLQSAVFTLQAGTYVLSCMVKGYKLSGAGTAVGLSCTLTGSFTGLASLPMVSPLREYVGQPTFAPQSTGGQQWYFMPPTGSFDWVQIGIYVQITGSTTVTLTGQKGVTGALAGQIWFDDFKSEAVAAGATRATITSRHQGAALPEKPVTWVEEYPEIPSLVEAAGLDGDFETAGSIAGWTPTNGAVTWEGGPGFGPGAYSGNGAMILTNTSGASATSVQSPAMPASAGQTYVAKMRVCPVASGNRTPNVAVSFYSDAAGTALISTVTGAGLLLPPNAWNIPNLGADTFLAPANTKSARVTMNVAASGVAAEPYRVDRFIFDVAPGGHTWSQQFTHLIDKITPSQPEGGMDVTLKLEASDIFKVLANANIASDSFQQNILAQSPTAYFPLSDPAGPGYVLDVVKGFTGQLEGSYVLGVQGPLVNSSAQAMDFGNDTGYVDNLPVSLGNIGSGAFSFAAWIYLGPVPVPAGAGGTLIMASTGFGQSQAALQVDASKRGNLYVGGAVTHYQVNSSVGLNDGFWHWIVGTRAADGKTMKMYMDGGLMNTLVAASVLPIVAVQVALGETVFSVSPNFEGQAAGVGFWIGTELTATQIANAFNASKPRWIGGTAGDFTNEILQAIGSGIPFGTGVSTGTQVFPQTSLQNLSDTLALDYLKTIAQSDVGYLFADPTGAVDFLSHNRLESSTYITPVATFGNNLAAGEVPYTHPDGPALEEDVIYNDIRRTQIAGREQRAVDSVSAGPQGYWPRRLDESGLLNIRDADVLAGAQYLLARYSQPHPRISEVVVRAMTGQPDQVWQNVIRRKLGDVVTYIFRPPRGPATTVNARIIKIEKTKRKNLMEAKFMLSSVDGLPFFTLDSSTFGVLDTSRLGY